MRIAEHNFMWPVKLLKTIFHVAFSELFISFIRPWGLQNIWAAALKPNHHLLFLLWSNFWREKFLKGIVITGEREDAPLNRVLWIVLEIQLQGTIS